MSQSEKRKTKPRDWNFPFLEGLLTLVRLRQASRLEMVALLKQDSNYFNKKQKEVPYRI